MNAITLAIEILSEDMRSLVDCHAHPDTGVIPPDEPEARDAYKRYCAAINGLEALAAAVEKAAPSAGEWSGERVATLLAQRDVPPKDGAALHAWAMQLVRDVAAQQAAQPVAPVKPGLTPDAQPVAGEPVASIYITPGGEREMDDWRHPLPVGRNILYTAAPAPVALTDEQWLKLRTAKTGLRLRRTHDERARAEFLAWMRFAEAALGIKAGKDGAA